MTTNLRNNFGTKCRSVTVLIFLSVLTIFQGTSLVAANNEDIWHGRPTMQAERYGHAAAVVNGKIYIIGGWNDADEILSTVEEYDPITERWRYRADLPTPRAGLTAAVVNNKIYAIGGQDRSDEPVTATVEEYDPITNQWTSKMSMPTPQRSFAAAAVGERIYTFGGWDGTNVFATVEEYDTNTDTWRTRADMPTPRVGLTATTVNGLIYVIGGSEEPDPWYTEELGTIEEYDPVSDSWRGLPPMPTNRWLLAATTIGGRLYAIGGQRDYVIRENSTSYFTDESYQIVEEYDPATYTWQTRANMTTGRWSFAAVTVGGKIYSLGGVNEFDWLSSVEVYDPPSYDTDEDSLADKDEIGSYGTNPFSLDTDNDGLTDGDEINAYGTDPVLSDATADTDGDGLTNVAEVDKYGTDPMLPDASADTDGDKLTNVEEVDTYYTNPLVSDTDNDGVDDGIEIDAGTDPKNPEAFPTETETVLIPVTTEGEIIFIPGYTSIPAIFGLSVLLLVFRRRSNRK